jgi:uncharacterized lipoprotein YddW (UPF0748 family)
LRSFVNDEAGTPVMLALPPLCPHSLAMIRSLILALLATCCGIASAQYRPSNERPPQLAREFRGAWVACIYNIDWPSARGLAANRQQAEARAILDKLVELKMNAVILQVRPHCDAIYSSQLEPWTPWLSGTMGRSPGYDALSFWIREAHARGIEVHAWFNPFRALANSSHGTSPNHVVRAAPHLTKPFGNMIWCDPALPETRGRALAAILDVVRRYDIDGVHLDDYFYPYPSGKSRFLDGKTPAQRRAYVDQFVENLYTSVKRQKPWVRVGISPFGIWRPGVPAGIEAGIDSYEDLAGDARKWLKNGWVDYLAPQLYWRISPHKQSFPVLLEWWRQQGTRPVWPGIASARINSSEDPGRPASEITNQIDLTRKIGKNWNGHIHWSAKSLMRNQGGIATRLASTYTQPAAIPPMPWVSDRPPAPVAFGAALEGSQTRVHWTGGETMWRVAVQVRIGRNWKTVSITPARANGLTIPRADAIALSAIDRYGNASPPRVLSLR